MSSTVAVLDFFVLEANDCIERLDGLLAAAAPEGPDADSFGRYARHLRGSATMSKQYGMAELAAALERLARALRHRALPWGPATSAPMIAAVDDLKILVRNVRTWGPGDDERVRRRTAELDRLAPSVAPRATPPTAAASAADGHAFVGSEITELARALDHLVAAPDDHAALTGVVDRVRALRGVAALGDLPPVGEVVDAVERTVKSVELTGGAGAVTHRVAGLFGAAAQVLRRAARDIAASGRPSAGAPELIAFNNALVSLSDESGKSDRILPITQLFYDDAGPHLVSVAPNPPTTAAERFRMEVVSLAEHLRRVVVEARAPRAPAEQERVLRDLRAALRALGSAANSFGERQVARFAAEWSVRATHPDEAALAALDGAAALLADPSTTAEDLARGLDRLAAPRSSGFTPPPSAVVTPPAASSVPAPQPTPARRAAAASAPSRPPAPAPAAPRAPAPPAAPPPAPPPRERVRTPTGRELHDYLQVGLAALAPLDERPLSAPVPVPDEEIVPIENLLYRGRAALERAAQLRDEIVAGGNAPSREAVQELFDLLDLALAD